MSKKQQQIPNTRPTSPAKDNVLEDACGAVRYNMTNDYMFRAVLVSSNKALRGLICSLLHLTEKEVISVQVTNGNLLGKDIENKEIRLDVNVSLNGSAMINLEMQIANQLNWQNRSVLYLCRSFDSISHGQDYSEAKPVIHIGFLDYTLFESRPEFYASYKLLNVKNYQKYSDTITLNVVDLSHIELATEEDKQYHIDDWAAFFKAATWEEIKMLAAKNEYIMEAAETMFQLSADEQIRKMCRDREEYYQDLKSYERAIAKWKSTLAECQSELVECKSELVERDNTIAEQDNALSELKTQIQQLLAENKRLKEQK